MKTSVMLGTGLLSAVATAQVTLVEPGHQLVLRMDSVAVLHPTQAILETTIPVGDIESICADPVTGDLFVQLIFPAGSPTSTTTHIFRLSPAAGGVVTPVAINTGFGINERGTDLHFDASKSMLVTQDQNFLPTERIAFASVVTGALGTWSLVATPPIFLGSTFGMDFANGVAQSIVPAGDIVFTADVAATGIHSCTWLGGTSTTHVPAAAMPGGGDDMVNQPDGDWIWVGDFTLPITKFAPSPPHTATPSALNLQGMFTAAGLPFINGSRAAVCDYTGVIYVTYSGATGGTGIFRIDEALTTATLVVTVGGPQGNQGIHDLEMGPSAAGNGGSLYFTVHDYTTGAEQVWEMTAAACCPTPASVVVTPDLLALNAPASIAAFPPGNLPQVGNAAFAVQVDDPGLACAIFPNSPTLLLLNFWPGSIVIPGAGCAPFTAGELMMPGPVIVAAGPVPWPGPGVGAVLPLPIPFDAALCGMPAYAQGLWIVPQRPTVLVLSWRLDLTIGS